MGPDDRKTVHVYYRDNDPPASKEKVWAYVEPVGVCFDSVGESGHRWFMTFVDQNQREVKVPLSDITGIADGRQGT